MQTPALQVEKIFRDKLAKFINANSERNAMERELNAIKSLLTNIFGYTESQMDQISQEVSNAKNNA